MERQDLMDDTSLKTSSQRQRRRDFVNDQVSDWTRSRTKAELTELLGGVVPFGQVNNAADILKDPHFVARKMLVPMKTGSPGTMLVSTPVKMTESPGGIKTPPPKLGEHTRAVLEEFGFGSEDIDRHFSSGAVR
jgi:crotonobetainyl-CoA:carnitine CoA-transferase CaiB-like acyl-CoA transferase